MYTPHDDIIKNSSLTRVLETDYLVQMDWVILLIQKTVETI